MTSQLNVDAIVDKAGSGGSNVKMANTSTYVSEGGATTANNVVQGLCKSYVSLNGASTPAIFGSFNVSGITDNAVGDTQYAFVSAMGDAVYSISGSTNDSGASTYHFSTATGNYRTIQRLDADGSTASDTDNSSSVHGDLA
mgnify:FL=1|tara:strand:+ start:26 stop:448 length:423 start_codon:yes stop_codon:yes gene_type:complete